MGMDVQDEGYFLDKILMLYDFGLQQISTRVNILRQELGSSQNCNPIEHVKIRLKTKNSIIDKCKRKNIELSQESVRQNIQDIAGIRIICSFKGDIYRVAAMLMQQPDIEVVSYKDYIENPKPNGYQSLHLVLEVPIFLTDRIEKVFVEVQVRTVAMDFWASLEHKIYYKQKLGLVPSHITDALKETADTVARLDEDMEKIHLEMQKLKH